MQKQCTDELGPSWSPYLSDPGSCNVPLPLFCHLLRNGYSVVHYKGPALTSQVDRSEEEVLLMLVHLP